MYACVNLDQETTILMEENEYRCWIFNYEIHNFNSTKKILCALVQDQRSYMILNITYHALSINTFHKIYKNDFCELFNLCEKDWQKAIYLVWLKPRTEVSIFKKLMEIKENWMKEEIVRKAILQIMDQSCICIYTHIPIPIHRVISRGQLFPGSAHSH